MVPRCIGMFRGPNAGLYLLGGQNVMREKPTGKTSVKNSATDWKRLRSKSGEEIRSGINEDPEVRATDAKFWQKAQVVLPRPNETVTIRLDADLVEWLRREKGYQTRINAVLRTYMDAQRP